MNDLERSALRFHGYSLFIVAMTLLLILGTNYYQDKSIDNLHQRITQLEQSE